MRLIDYQAAIDRYYVEYKKQDICDGSEDRDWLKRCFDEAPTIDAVPVVHGRWKPYKTPLDTRQTGWICTNCSFVNHDLSNGDTNYCPNCGAKMDLEG